MDTATFLVELTRRIDIGFDYEVVAARSGKHFLPGIGYTRREDFTQLRGRVSYDWLMGKETSIRKVSPLQFSGYIVLRNEDGSVESAHLAYDTDLQWKSGADVWIDFEMDYEDLLEDEDFPEDTVIPAGSYTNFKTEGGFDTPDGNLFRADFDWAFGSFFHGWRFDVGVEPTWNVSRHLEMSSEYEVNVVRFPDRHQGFNAHVVRLRTRAALNTQVSLNAFVQYNSASDRFSTNIRFRYNFREGNDLWLVYNENLNTYTDYDEIPRQLLTRGRTVLLKYTNTFDL